MKFIFALSWLFSMVGIITMIFGYIWIEEQQWYMDNMFITFIAVFFISLFLFSIWPDDREKTEKAENKPPCKSCAVYHMRFEEYDFCPKCGTAFNRPYKD